MARRDTAVEDRIKRLETVFNDIVDLQIDDMAEAAVSEGRGEHILFIYDEVAKRLNYASYMDYLREFDEFERSRDSNSSGVAELRDEAELCGTVLLAAMSGAGLTPLLEWGVRSNTKSFGSPYKYAFNPKARATIKAQVYLQRGRQEIHRKVFREEISFDEGVRRMGVYDRMAGEALKQADLLKVHSSRIPPADQALFTAEMRRMRSKTHTMRNTAALLGDITAKGLEVFDFFGSLVSVIQGERAKDDIEKSIEDSVWMRFVWYRYKYQFEIWRTFETQITAAAGIWVALHDNANGTSTCYAGADATLAAQSDLITGRMLEAYANLTDDVVYQRIKGVDAAQGHASTPFDPSKDRLWAILRSKGLLTPTDSEDNSTQTDNIFEDTPGSLLAPSQTNGTNIRYAEFGNGAGAIWKLTGPFWSVQLAKTSRGQPARHRLVQLERKPTKVLFRLDATEGVPPTETVLVTLNVAAGVGELSWPGLGTLALDVDTPSNLIPTNGWTLFWTQSNLAGLTPTSLTPQSFQQCSLQAGWAATVWKDQARSNIVEVARNKTYVAGATVVEFEGEIFETLPAFAIDLAAGTIKYGERVPVGDVHRTSALDRESMMPRVYVE
ncbi:hypothetical protein QBC34DRAFT_475374 [Podospora aff. communis PSN243]|uniref:Uncharacterized protein n=1 Tax=Podospora aff. communis PSN243 TaxID=3040156 RepID=A0AAV9G5P8_9PEZI|nr:hypothetical protein QBC34DRAFT_475374 [Podospora aff. communis PSN243]